MRKYCLTTWYRQSNKYVPACVAWLYAIRDNEAVRLIIAGRKVELISFKANALASTLMTNAMIVLSSQKVAAAQKYLLARK